MATAVASQSTPARQNVWQLVVSVVFLLAFGYCLHKVKSLADTNLLHALFWFGGAILACETALDHVSWKGWKRDAVSILLRVVAFVIAAWAMDLG